MTKKEKEKINKLISTIEIRICALKKSEEEIQKELAPINNPEIKKALDLMLGAQLVSHMSDLALMLASLKRIHTA